MKNILIVARKEIQEGLRNRWVLATTLLLAGLALAIRFVHYSDNHGHFRLGWWHVMAAIFVVVAGASVYLVYVLEILKFRRFMRRARPEATEAEIDEAVSDSLETGEFEAVR